MTYFLVVYNFQFRPDRVGIELGMYIMKSIYLIFFNIFSDTFSSCVMSLLRTWIMFLFRPMYVCSFCGTFSIRWILLRYKSTRDFRLNRIEWNIMNENVNPPFSPTNLPPSLLKKGRFLVDIQNVFFMSHQMFERRSWAGWYVKRFVGLCVRTDVDCGFTFLIWGESHRKC